MNNNTKPVMPMAAIRGSTVDPLKRYKGNPVSFVVVICKSLRHTAVDEFVDVSNLNAWIIKQEVPGSNVGPTDSTGCGMLYLLWQDTTVSYVHAKVIRLVFSRFPLT